MIERARALHPTTARCSFTADSASLLPADYVLASGIFNVKLDIETGVWRDHVLETLETLDALGRSGFAFNMLSTSSDPKRQRGDLFYAEPLFFFDHCTRRFSPRVALLHDYPFYEFTLVVRK